MLGTGDDQGGGEHGGGQREDDGIAGVTGQDAEPGRAPPFLPRTHPKWEAGCR